LIERNADDLRPLGESFYFAGRNPIGCAVDEGELNAQLAAEPSHQVVQLRIWRSRETNNDIQVLRGLTCCGEIAMEFR